MKTYNFRFKVVGKEGTASADTEEEAFKAFLTMVKPTGIQPVLTYENGMPNFTYTNIDLPDFFYWEADGENNPEPTGFTGYHVRGWLEKRLMKFTEIKM